MIIMCTELCTCTMSPFHILQIIQGGKVSRYAKLNCNLLENIHGWTVVLYGQSLLHRLFHWKSVVVTDRSMKTTKLFHLAQLAIYIK